MERGKQYILDFQGFLDGGITDAKVLYGKMMSKYGCRLAGNKGVVMGSCAAALAAQKGQLEPLTLVL